MFFKSQKSQNDSAIFPISYQVFTFYELLTHLDLLNWVFVYFSFSTQKVNIMIKKQIHMYLNFADPSIKNFHDFWVFVLSHILKNENLEIMEIHQKPKNTEIWECKYWNIVQMISFSKWFSHHTNHVPYFCLSRDFGSSKFVKLSLLFFFCLLQF